MSKRPDFGVDLNQVKLDVRENVSDILTAAKERVAQRNLSPTSQHERVSHTPPREVPESKNIVRTQPTPKQATRPAAKEREVFQNVTTKLTPETKKRLRQAARLQEAHEREPHTEYAIVNEAVQQWLKRHGYGGRWKSEEAAPPEAESTEEGAAEDR